MSCDKKITNKLKLILIVNIKQYSRKENLKYVRINKISYDRYSNHKKKEVSTCKCVLIVSEHQKI